MMDEGARRRYTSEMRESLLGSSAILIVTFLLMLGVVLIAGPSSAEEWMRGSREVNEIKPWSGANYTPDADTTSPTLHTGRCQSITVSCWGTTLSSIIELCNSAYLYNATPSTTECNDLSSILVDCANEHSVQIDPAPEFIRMQDGTNFGSSQYFRAFCNGTH